MEAKETLRRKYRKIRDDIPEEQRLQSDVVILQRVLASEVYQHCRTVLTYVSFGSEVSTSALIEQALSDGKEVAVPVSNPATCEIRFYRIASLRELRPAAYGILEPKPNPKQEVFGDAESLCIVPGLCFDRKGYRIGYGKGYYDRFLSGFLGKTAGLCRKNSVYLGELPKNQFDLPVNFLFTDETV